MTFILTIFPSWFSQIRMQAQGSVIQGSMMGNFINIYQQEGTRGLWKGVSLTAQRAAIVVGVELPAYDLAKKHLILDCHMGDNIYTHFLSSFACGLAGALASNPIDVVRTRMMNQTYGAVTYQGTLDCLLQTSRSEGFMALYKGFFPNWLRLGPWNIIVSFHLLSEVCMFSFVYVYLLLTVCTRVEVNSSLILICRVGHGVSL
ncbi:unnamed protein product [Oncorhynchus mykiss]|uniref:Solute carrier family 25 member 30 n=1 Tax=Oncorhynchus mykiss TaxID=8022 RepID=A0A060Z908_ONCMY|nr:unnamed protein product [Oncorhynchus mykiss]